MFKLIKNAKPALIDLRNTRAAKWTCVEFWTTFLGGGNLLTNLGFLILIQLYASNVKTNDIVVSEIYDEMWESYLD